jgi:hypothetical protein
MVLAQTPGPVTNVGSWLRSAPPHGLPAAASGRDDLLWCSAAG